jgi:hypothetical protein
MNQRRKFRPTVNGLEQRLALNGSFGHALGAAGAGHIDAAVPQAHKGSGDKGSGHHHTGGDKSGGHHHTGGDKGGGHHHTGGDKGGGKHHH